MSFTVIIPARLKSSRLPDKPLADICGRPMIVRVAERALSCGADRVVVAVDDASVYAYARHFLQCSTTFHAPYLLITQHEWFEN